MCKLASKGDQRTWKCAMTCTHMRLRLGIWGQDGDKLGQGLPIEPWRGRKSVLAERYILGGVGCFV